MKQPTFDLEGDPTEETLEAIRTWPLEDISGFWDFMKAAWNTGMSSEPDESKKFIAFYADHWSDNELLMRALRENRPIWNRLWQYYSGPGYRFARTPEIAAAIDREDSTTLPVKISPRFIRWLRSRWTDYTSKHSGEPSLVLDGLVYSPDNGKPLVTITNLGGIDHSIYLREEIDTPRIVLRFMRGLFRHSRAIAALNVNDDLHEQLEQECRRAVEYQNPKKQSCFVIAIDSQSRALGKFIYRPGHYELYFPLKVNDDSFDKLKPTDDQTTAGIILNVYWPFVIRESGVRIRRIK